jgi:large repetitive protein
MAELTSLATYFPQVLGEFWFAAGVSFTSFALVDGVVVVSVEIGDGLQIAIFGLARMALPRPQFPLVSIELGLIARFSSKEGVLWVQAQLTDNSWLLYPDVRLTGGFAYVMWFLGPLSGQFVLTIGGYHPRFHRDGYPDVPRLGLQWRVGPFLTIKGESYFALTSEAIMAGARIEVSAEFGPAWAHLVLGADGIVYFDPFHFEVEVYCSI